jgi:hypothetical protein
MGTPPTLCSVEGCINAATLKVMLEDFNPGFGGDGKFCEQDRSCPYMCHFCAETNEKESTGRGRGRRYPFSKWGGRKMVIEGWTTYRDISHPRRRVEIRAFIHNQ